MKAKRVLFSFWDGGYGHLKRVLPIAKFLHSNGYSIGIISSKKFVNYLSTLKYITYIFEIENRKEKIHSIPYQFPIYSHAFRHAQRLCGLEFNDINFLQNIINKELEVIKEFKPKLIINDYRDTIKISSEITNIPLVGITTSNGNSAGYPMGWWVDIPDEMVLPDCRTSFNVIRKKYNLKPIKDERESFEGDLCIIPSSETIEPLASPRSKDFYVGPLNKLPCSEPNSKIESIVNNKKIVFWYLGEDNNRTQCDFDTILREIIANFNLFFVVSGPESRYQNTFSSSHLYSNLCIKNFFSGEDYSWIIKNASLIINHGSTTTLLGLSQGVPFVNIPWNTESNMAIMGSRFGAGMYLPHSKSPLQRKHAPDLGDNVEIMGYWHSEITSQKIGEAIGEVISNDNYKAKALTIAEELNKYNGGELLINLLANMS